jgi:branched-chain amino acid transport system ATP-binding protein
MRDLLRRRSGVASPSTETGDGLTVDALEAGYGHVPVLRGVSLVARPGECVALLGPNGVGKTTTISAIAGVVRATGGEIRFAGRSLRDLAPHEVVRHGIAVVPEGRRLYGGMTVEENLQMGAYAARRAEVAERLQELYDVFPRLAQMRDQLAGNLSGGQQQLSAIGRALMSRPRLLLIDELSMGLSPAAVTEVTDAIAVAKQTFGPTMLLVDQDIEVAAGIATRGYFLDQGRVVASGPMRELREVELIRRLYFTADPHEDTNKAVPKEAA